MKTIRNVYLRIDESSHREVRVLAARTNRRVEDLYNEAVALLLAKHGVEVPTIHVNDSPDQPAPEPSK